MFLEALFSSYTWLNLNLEEGLHLYIILLRSARYLFVDKFIKGKPQLQMSTTVLP